MNKPNSLSESPIILVERVELSRKDLFSYGFPALALAFAGLPLYIHAPDYFATEFNVSLGLLGLILLFLRAIDAIQDPIIGYLSDKYYWHRHHILLGSALILVISFLALFQPLIHGFFGILIWFGLMMFLATSCYSVFAINLNTIGGLWSSDSHQKTRISAMREALSLIGLLVAVILPSVLQLYTPKNLAFLVVSILLILLMLLSLVVFQIWQRDYLGTINQNLSIQPDVSIGKNNNQIRMLSSILKQSSPSTRQFFKIYFISMLASSIPAVLVLFFIRDYLGAEKFTGLFLLIYFLSSAAFMPVWTKLSQKYGKYHAWGQSMALAVLVFIWAFFLSPGDIWQYALICLLSGMAFGADLSLPASILADEIQNQNQAKEASLNFGLLSFFAKLALAIASVLSFTSLEFLSFEAGEINSPSALFGLSLIYALIPCVIKLISLKSIYNLKKQG